MTLISPYITPDTVAEALCLVAAGFLLPSNRDRKWRVHRYYLAAMLLLELAGVGGYRTQVHNIQLLATALFVSWFLFDRIGALWPIPRYVLWIWLLLFGLVYAGEAYHYGGLTHFLADALLCLQAGVLLASLGYCWLLLLQPEYQGLAASPDFWWVFGTAYFFFGMAVCRAFFTQGVEVPRLIISGLNFLLYGSWMFTFYLCHRRS